MIFPQNRHSHFCITPFSKIYLMELWLTRNILKNGNHSHRDKKQILIRSHTRRDDRFEYSKTRGWHAKNLHRSPPVTPVFTDRFQKLKWIRYFSIRKTNFPPGINFTFSSSCILPHPSPYTCSPDGSTGFKSFDPAYRSDNRVYEVSIRGRLELFIRLKYSKRR